MTRRELCIACAERGNHDFGHGLQCGDNGVNCIECGSAMCLECLAPRQKVRAEYFTMLSQERDICMFREECPGMNILCRHCAAKKKLERRAAHLELEGAGRRRGDVESPISARRGPEERRAQIRANFLAIVKKDARTLMDEWSGDCEDYSRGRRSEPASGGGSQDGRGGAEAVYSEAEIEADFDELSVVDSDFDSDVEYEPEPFPVRVPDAGHYCRGCVDIGCINYFLELHPNLDIDRYGFGMCGNDGPFCAVCSMGLCFACAEEPAQQFVGAACRACAAMGALAAEVREREAGLADLGDA